MALAKLLHIGENTLAFGKILPPGSPILKAHIFFADEMVKGAFKTLRHEHHFFATEEGTMMKDIFNFESPLGILGKLANTLFLKSYMTNFLKNRNEIIKEFAESGRWKELLPEKNVEYKD